jgi:hypothetical protein
MMWTGTSMEKRSDWGRPWVREPAPRPESAATGDRAEERDGQAR